MERYARQIILPELGIEGQKRLNHARVLMVGAGGLGCPALLYLVGAGVGHITVMDADEVSESNLHRQVLYAESHVGQNKAEAACQILKAHNTEVELVALAQRFDATNAEQLLKNVDVVIDGTDNFASKFLINDACVKYNKPMVYASILGFEAQVSVFWASLGACYRCLFPAPPQGHVPNCAEAGVLGALAGMAGAMQALEAIKLCLGQEHCERVGLQPLLGKLWVMDSKTLQTRLLALPKSTQCTVCSKTSENITLHAPEQGCALQSKLIDVDASHLGDWLSKAQVIDVREPLELVLGKLPNARNIALRDLIENKDILQTLDNTKPVLLYCQSGVRSAHAGQFLLELGFTNVAHLRGGFGALKLTLS